MQTHLHWKHDLKSPTQEGTYPIPGTSYKVIVEAGHIEDAANYDGNVRYKLLDARNLQNADTFKLGTIGVADA